MDWEAAGNIDGNKNDDVEYDFFKKNYGDGKLFPGGPSCFHKGKEIPAFVGERNVSFPTSRWPPIKI